MCNGSSTRVSQGGSIAVLRPTAHLRRTPSEDEMLLLFRNQFSSPGTCVEIQGLDPHLAEEGGHWIVIHQDGDLTTTADSNTLYSFSLTAESESTLLLPQKLDLGVGGAGIIGRRVSMMRGEVAVAEGIIGWN